MKYSSNNKPLICMQTQSTCYKGTSKMTPKGVLWHSTGANNPTLKRYVQPSDVKPPEDTYSKDEWLKKLGTNTNKNDWNHVERRAGLNAWIGKLANGTVTSIQTMPWDFSPWGCGSGSKGSCNNGWMQFEICEDGLSDKNYFNAIYQEACELTAYYCKLYNINPKGTVSYKGVTVPTILCHQDSYKLGLGSNHGDIYHWFNKHGKTMDDVRNDVYNLIYGDNSGSNTKTITKTTKLDITYQIWDDVKNKWLPNVTNELDYAGNLNNDVCAVYANLAEGSCVYKVHTLGTKKWLPEVKDRTDYAGIFNQPIDAFMIKSTDPNVKVYYQVHTKGGKWLSYVSGYNTNDSTYGYAGIIGKSIDGIRMYAEKTTTTTIVVPAPAPTPAPQPAPTKYYRVRKTWADSKSQIGAYTTLENAIEKCQSAGEGYKVFDWNGKEVYAYKAPQPEVKPTPTPTPEVKPVPTPQPEPEIEVVPTPIEPDPKPEIEIIPDPKPDIEIIPEPEPEIEIEVVPEPEIEVVPEPEPEIIPEPQTDWIAIITDLVKRLITAIIEVFKNAR